MKIFKCFHCEKDIVVGVDKYFMQAIETPYVNLFFHTDCLREIELNGDFIEYLTEKSDIIYNMNSKTKQNRRIDGTEKTIKSADEKSGTVQVTV